MVRQGQCMTRMLPGVCALTNALFLGHLCVGDSQLQHVYFTFVCSCAYMSFDMRVEASVDINIHVYMYIYMHKYMYTNIFEYMRIHNFEYVPIIHMYIYTHIYLY